MRKFTLLLFLGFLFSQCDQNVEKSFVISPLIHDGSSKIWLVKQIHLDGVNYEPKTLAEKDTYIFFQSGVVYVQPFMLLGNANPKKGKFIVNDFKKELTIYFDHEYWNFKIVNINHKSMELIPLKDSDFIYRFTLETLPEY